MAIYFTIDNNIFITDDIFMKGDTKLTEDRSVAYSNSIRVA